MRNESHKTLIGILREHVADWRRAAGLLGCRTAAPST